MKSRKKDQKLKKELKNKLGASSRGQACRKKETGASSRGLACRKTTSSRRSPRTSKSGNTGLPGSRSFPPSLKSPSMIRYIYNIDRGVSIALPERPDHPNIKQKILKSKD